MLAAEHPRDAKFRENAAWLRKYKPMDFGVEPDVRFLSFFFLFCFLEVLF